MVDYTDQEKKNEELEAILRELRGEPEIAPKEEDEPSKSWSMEDIDKLIADANGEEYIPPEPKESAHDKFAKFFTAEFDEELFTIRPMSAPEEPVEMQDIFSGASTEVEGQETLFDDEEEPEDDFVFNMETVVIPDDIPASPADKFIKQADKAEEPAAVDKKRKKAEKKAVQEPEEEENPVDYRAKFFTKLRLEDIEMPQEEEKVEEGPVDKSGIVVCKSDEEAEEDLEAMPTVLAAEDVEKHASEKTKIAEVPTPEVKKESGNDDVEGQIVLNGFVDIPDEAIPAKSTVGEVEENLWERRKKKAATFKLEEFEDDFSDEFDAIPDDVPELPAEEEIPEVDDSTTVSLVDTVGEYNTPDDRNEIHSKLSARISKMLKKVMAIGIIDLLLILAAVIPAVAEFFSAETSFFSTTSVPLCVLNALLIIGAAALDSEKFFDSFSGLIKGKITGDTATALAVAVALVENTVSAVSGSGAPVFGAVAVFGIFVGKLTDYINARRILSNFNVCAFNYDHNMYAVHSFDNESEIFELGRGLLMGDAEMLYSSKVEFPSDFIENSDKNSSSEKYTTYMVIGSAVLSLITAIIVGIAHRDAFLISGFMSGLSAFAGTFCLTAPIFGKFIPSFINYITNRRLNSEGTMIVNMDAAEKAAGANAVVLDSADIFDRKGCTMHGMKDFKSMRMDVVLLYAAAMVIKSGGPLKECFDNVVDGRQDLLPPVRELVYEDKMGISARIYEQKVLLGNRNMLIHHNIKAPDKEFEEKYQHDGRKIIYLACNEQLAAMFVVSYKVDETMKNYLNQLEKNGVQILVRTNDVNVTEELISERFGISPNNFKILSSVAGRLFKRRKDTVSDVLPAEIIHDGEPRSMLRAVASACSMAAKNKLGTALQIAVMLLGMILAVVIGAGNEIGLTSVWAIIIMVIESVGLTGVLSLGKK